jgi:hypothetical protein
MFRRAFLFLSLVCFAWGAVGCSPHIGDKCVLNTDCSITGNLQCDTSMPGGYCTMFNCGPNSCPNGNACYLFHADVQGCPYDDRQPSRTAHSFCLEDCNQNSDCRYGYSCHDLRQYPWYAILLDDNQNQQVCSPNLDPSFFEAVPDANGPVAPICDPSGDYDAQFPSEPFEDAGAEDAGDAAPVADGGGGDADGSFDASIDATLDAGIDATTGLDGGAPDSGAFDATLD